MKHPRFLTWPYQNLLRRKVRESVSDKWTNAQMLPPTIIFTGKTEQTIRNVNIPLGVIVKRRKKACMNDDLIEIWV